MANGLLDTEHVDLQLITAGPVDRLTEVRGRMKQWVVPNTIQPDRRGLISERDVQPIKGIVRDFGPDLLHVWGTEQYWGLLTGRGYFSPPALLEMQGLKGPIAKVYFGGLTWKERIACIGLRELLKWSLMGQERRAFARWEPREAEMIRRHRFITVQSPWMAAQIRAINASATLFETERALRSAFYSAAPWLPPSAPVIFCTSAYSVPFKGLHLAIRVLSNLRRRIPGARLRIAGEHQRNGLRRVGYIRWINRLIGRLGLENAVEWLGPLSAEELADELASAAVALIPTFVESYCVALAEAMQIGTPTVVAYTGGTSYLAADEETSLFFAAGDEAMCTYQVERLLTDSDLAERLSRRARLVAGVRNDRDTVVRNQANIYRKTVVQARLRCEPALRGALLHEL
jgi:glycosyltransferase involved in cell wall biosynthesis